MDVAMDLDPDTDMFILIRPCSDQCHTIGVNGWVYPLFLSIAPFPASGKPCPRSAKLPKKKGGAHRTGLQKCSSV